MCLPECQHSTTRKPRCRRCFGFRVSQHHSVAWPIAYYCWPCLSTCKDSKELTIEWQYWKLPLSLQPHCLLMPPFRLVLTHKPSWISIKLIPSECLHFAGDNVGIFLQKSVMNSENTSIFETRVYNGPQCHPRSLILAKIERAYYLVIINNNLGGILPQFRDCAGFLLKQHSIPIWYEF